MKKYDDYLISTRPRTRKDYSKIKLEDLYEGNILPIYQDWREQKIIMGYAKLNHLVEDPNMPYERGTVGFAQVNEPDMVIFKHQRWNITYVDPQEIYPDIPTDLRWLCISQKDFTTNWNIAYFESIDSNHIS